MTSSAVGDRQNPVSLRSCEPEHQRAVRRVAAAALPQLERLAIGSITSCAPAASISSRTICSTVAQHPVAERQPRVDARWRPGGCSPARTSSRWLSTSASAGSSRSVRRKSSGHPHDATDGHCGDGYRRRRSDPSRIAGTAGSRRPNTRLTRSDLFPTSLLAFRPATSLASSLVIRVPRRPEHLHGPHPPRGAGRAVSRRGPRVAPDPRAHAPRSRTPDRRAAPPPVRRHPSTR